MAAATRAERCRNLYQFIRYRLGRAPSDREIARRWGMEWRSFAALKHGERQMPRVHELEQLAAVVGVDPEVVFQVARGQDAAEAAAHLSTENRLRAVLERVTDGVFTMDREGRLQDANRRFCALVGRSFGDLVGRSLFDLLVPEMAPRAVAALSRLGTEDAVHGIELELATPAGSAVLEMDALVIREPDGRAIGAQAILRDVTARKQLVLHLERKRRSLQAIFDFIPAACVLFERDGTISAANPLVEEVCPLAAGEMIGRPALEVFGEPGPGGCPVQRCFQSGRIEQQASWVTNRAGQRVYVHRVAGPIREQGQIRQVIEILVDVGEQVARGDLRLLALWPGQQPISGSRAERRIMPRVRAAFEARVRRGRRWEVAHVENLSAGGLFVQTDHPPPRGTEVQIEWALPPEGARVRARAVAIWIREGTRAHPGGFGVRFLEVRPAS